MVAVLILHPVLAEEGPLRLVAVGTGADVVEWSIDGTVVANTTHGVAAAVQVTAGEHTVVARTVHRASWTALVRSEPRTAGIEHVPAWTAHWDADEAPVMPMAKGPPVGMAVGALCLSAFAALGWRRVQLRRVQP